MALDLFCLELNLHLNMIKIMDGYLIFHNIINAGMMKMDFTIIKMDNLLIQKILTMMIMMTIMKMVKYFFKTMINSLRI